MGTYQKMYRLESFKLTSTLSQSVSQSDQSLSRVPLCHPVDYRTPGSPVHHQLLEPTQTHVHPTGNATQPSHPVFPFTSCLQSFPASRSFQMNQFYASGSQSVGVSASASVFPMNIQDWFPLGWTGWISLQSKTLKRLLQHHSSKASILWRSAFFIVQLSHPYMTIGKAIALTRRTFVGKGISLLFNMLSRLVMRNGN